MGEFIDNTSFPHRLCFFDRTPRVSLDYFFMDGLYLPQRRETKVENKSLHCFHGYFFKFYPISTLLGSPLPEGNFSVLVNKVPRSWWGCEREC